jgi:SAM-dependent methyltransferase
MSTQADRAAHWERVYCSKAVDATSWYRPHLDRSLTLIDRMGLETSAAVIDVGCGASSFLADLRERGFRDLTGLDVAPRAIELAQASLGADAGAVGWITGDVLSVDLPADRFDLWHDRAAFHFLTAAAEQDRYAAVAAAALRRGGHAIVSGFAADGPSRCSDLEVCRMSPETIAQRLGPAFEIVDAGDEVHVTPWGARQLFSICLLRRR